MEKPELKAWLPALLVLSLILVPVLSASVDVEIGTNVTLTAVKSGIFFLSEPVGYNVTSIMINLTNIVFEYPAYQNETGDYWEENDTLNWNGTSYQATTYDFPCIRAGTCGSSPSGLVDDIVPKAFLIGGIIAYLFWSQLR